MDDYYEVYYRIGPSTRFTMIVTALILDIIQFILSLLLVGALLNYILVGLAIVIFFFWFSIRSVALADWQTIKLLGKGTAGEIIPWVNGFIPTCYITVKRIIEKSQKEDEEEHESNINQAFNAQKKQSN